MPVTLTDLVLRRSNFFGLTVVNPAGESGILTEVPYTTKEREGRIHLVVSERPKPSSQELQKQDPDGEVVFAWDIVQEAIFYNLYLSESSRVDRQTGKKIANVSNPHTLTGLKRGVDYYVVITAVTETAESKESEELRFLIE
jgi:hypothetical protein